MLNFEKFSTRLLPDHIAALRWFQDHAGQTVSWTDIQDHATGGSRLVTQAKGIYKPAYTEFALSVRQTLNSIYVDLPLETHENGDWYYQYFQENEDPDKRDKEATNRGLVKCLDDGVPVGVLIQNKPKPGVTYLVVGLAYVDSWKDGWFTLDGATNQQYRDDGPALTGAQQAILSAESVSQVDPFDLASNVEMRERNVAEVVRRRGQGKFRRELLAAYGSRCAITECDAVEALEAAHISPYLGGAANHVQNGLLLRADVHSLFDLGLIAINADKMAVVLDASLRSTTYGELSGKALRLPENANMAPSHDALAAHFAWAGFKEP